jgi:branched-chain amino acid transport system ATP-binding protein
MTMLAVEGLASGYQQIPIVLGVSFALRPDEFLGILGHNGMGKSTLLKTLAGQLPATRGKVVFDGVDVTRMPPNRRARLGLGYVPQGRRIFPNLTCRDNLRMGAVGGGVDEAIIDEVLVSFPRLLPILDRAGNVLSGGEQQILALARCLCAKPKLVLLDEPTEGIQPSIIEEIIDTLLEFKRRQGLTIILVEQNLDFIRRLSDRVLIIQKGRIRTEVSPEQLGDAEMLADYVGADA